MDRAFFLPFFIARPENNAKNSAPQSVNYCVTDFRRTPVRLQICSLQFALCSTAFFALFSGLAIDGSAGELIHPFFPQKNNATVPGPVWLPMVVPMLLISTFPFRLGKRSSIRSATARASS